MISIVIPAYNEAKTLHQNIAEIMSYLKNYECEVIIVDDGSKDETWDIITTLGNEYENIKGIKFSRNFGKEAALLAGVTEAEGEAVITMDSDLQHPPRYIKDLIEKWEEGYKVVECVRNKRSKESIFYKICATIFYKSLRKFTGVDMANGGDYKIMDRQVVDEVKRLMDTELFFRGMVNWVGFETVQLKIDIDERKGDTSKFNIKSLSKLAIAAITSFSEMPLTIPIKAGAFSTVLAVIYIVLGCMLSNTENIGIVYLFGTILQLFLGLLTLLSLGIIGLYIGKVYEQVKGRPRYIIQERFNF